MKRRSSLRSRGFTLLEVMVAMAILAIALGAVFSAEAGSVRMAGRARKLGFASTLVRCKMGEIEEQIAKEGFPAAFDEGEDNCCKDAEIAGFTCKWEIEPVAMPDEMFEPEEGANGEKADDKDSEHGKDGADKDKTGKDTKSGTDSKTGSDGKKGSDGKSTTDVLKEAIGSAKGSKKLDPTELLKDPKKLLGGGSTPGGAAMGMGAAMGLGSGTGSGSGSGSDEEGGPPDMDAIASMAMQYVYPILKPSFESQIRRATVTVMWNEGSAAKKFDVTQYLVAEQPIQIPGLDPNAQNTTGTGTGSTTGSTTGSNTGNLFGSSPGSSSSSSGGTQTKSGGLFQPRTNFGILGSGSP